MRTIELDCVLKQSVTSFEFAVKSAYNTECHTQKGNVSFYTFPSNEYKEMTQGVCNKV